MPEENFELILFGKSFMSSFYVTGAPGAGYICSGLEARFKHGSCINVHTVQKINARCDDIKVSSLIFHKKGQPNGSRLTNQCIFG